MIVKIITKGIGRDTQFVNDDGTLITHVVAATVYIVADDVVTADVELIAPSADLDVDDDNVTWGGLERVPTKALQDELDRRNRLEALMQRTNGGES